ncbi:hypothetical protein B0I35DRAFT_356262 [Stachybotrys elegans]|uniref:Uncharacterized protein n=1 Tax=Stachybotrys elegans TaxID=80388 RepID=A0A8K0WPG1_9HYPO|nr:hypothetical protein B0I35DRAFT_356262 [Stachybotrys elegans]
MQFAPARAPLKPRDSERSHDSGGGIDAPRKSLSYALRPEAYAYYDSRAATRKEYKRRAQTLQEYYDDNPNLLPQLPFTWHHGKKRWRLILFAFLVVVDASLVPIALYYAMAYGGNVPGWIIFAVVTTIWGGPTYLEFAIRTLRLMKKERFYRPLGTESRWCFDLLNWASTLTIFVVTVLFIVGSAPHNVWLRVLCMPAPAILYCLGGVLAVLTLFHDMKWSAPFRISSTAKGEQVLPGIYYFVEDTVAVNAGGGRPYREAIAARYKASPRFRRMLWVQSWFWAIPSLLVAIPLTVIAVIPPVPPTIAYGICWAVPFLWASLWGIITVYMCKRDMRNERLEWQASEEKSSLTPPTAAAPAVTPPSEVPTMTPVTLSGKPLAPALKESSHHIPEAPEAE